MCGRYTLSISHEELLTALDIDRALMRHEPRYNIAPSQPVPAIVSDGAERRLGPLRWGLVPGWTRARTTPGGHINARAESVGRKPTFRESFAGRRCLIPADGFYEWEKTPEGKRPMRVRRRGERPFAFAGIWDRWQPPDTDEPLYSCAILTTAAADSIRHIHDRMPVILPEDDGRLWLDPEARPDALEALLRPYQGGDLEAYEVSRIVNSARNEVPECILPVAAEAP